MQLQNGRLKIDIAETGEIFTQRFDQTIIIKQVTLDRRYEFCVPEQYEFGRATTNGIGLCGEFAADDLGREAKKGEYFPKPGVGLIKQFRDYEPFDKWRIYETKPFRTERDVTDGWIRSRQVPIPCLGIAVEIEKTIHLEENRLILDTKVINHGERPCYLKEYQHNFIGINRRKVDSSYTLELPGDERLKEAENSVVWRENDAPISGIVSVKEGCLNWNSPMEGRVLYKRSDSVKQDGGGFWRIRHQEEGVSVTGLTEFVPDRIDLWSVGHCISPELYIYVPLSVGETRSWRRQWVFEADRECRD